MRKLGIADINKDYWMAARQRTTSDIVNFGIIGCNGYSLGHYSLLEFRNRNNKVDIWAYDDDNFGLRPVFKLRSNVRITGGSGTRTNPYKLGI